MTDYLWHTSVEPICISDLCSEPKQFPIAVCILSWLIEQLQQDQTIETSHLLLDVAFHGMLGKYPALVIRFKGRDPADDELWDTEQDLVRRADQILTERSVSDLASYIQKSNQDWEQVTQDLMTTYHAHE